MIKVYFYDGSQFDAADIGNCSILIVNMKMFFLAQILKGLTFGIRGNIILHYFTLLIHRIPQTLFV